MYLKRSLILPLLMAPFVSPLFMAYGQGYDVTVSELSVAQAYDVGAQGVDTGFGTELWAGISAGQAISLIGQASTKSKSAATNDLLARVLLTGGTPPQGAQSDNSYLKARLGTLVKLGRGDAVDQILGRQPQQAGSEKGQQVQADKALLEGKRDAACNIADNISEARSEPYWVKLRSFCHVVRDEVPAGELSVDLLRRSGHEDKVFYAAFDRIIGIRNAKIAQGSDDPLLLSMAEFAGVKVTVKKGENGDAALKMLLKDVHELSKTDLAARLAKLTLTNDGQKDQKTEALVEGQAEFFDMEAALKSQSARSWGQLYGVATRGTDVRDIARASGELLRRADKKGALTPFANLLDDVIGTIPTYLRSEGDVPTFAKLAVMEADLTALRGLYEGLENDDPLKPRLALASDALGNGFMLGQIGADMSARLGEGGETRQRAIRDVFIAVSLGAALSADSTKSLDGFIGNSKGQLSGKAASPIALMALSAASRRGGQAETALRAAAILGEGGPQALRADSLAIVLKALQEVGLIELSGRLAAEDFLAYQ